MQAFVVLAFSRQERAKFFPQYKKNYVVHSLTLRLVLHPDNMEHAVQEKCVPFKVSATLAKKDGSYFPG